jgi:hypothetical protein
MGASSTRTHVPTILSFTHFFHHPQPSERPAHNAHRWVWEWRKRLTSSWALSSGGFSVVPYPLDDASPFDGRPSPCMAPFEHRRSKRFLSAHHRAVAWDLPTQWWIHPQPAVMGMGWTHPRRVPQQNFIHYFYSIEYHLLLFALVKEINYPN